MKWKILGLPILLIATLSLSAALHAETVWIDVRSAVEHKIDNIEGDIRIPHSEVVEQVGSLYPDKTTEIRLYCRSGGRAEKALIALEAAGYSDVKNIGGIDDARARRGAGE